MPTEIEPNSSPLTIRSRARSTENAEGTPRYLTMAAELRQSIATGELKPGDRLPSFAEMRQQYNATVTTIERVYGMLEREGLIERRQGVGTFVAVPRRVATGNIGFLGTALPRRHQQVYYGHLMEGVQAAVEEHERHLLFVGTGGRWNRDALDKVDGILLCNIDKPSTLLQDFPPDLPCVSLLSNVPNLASVVPDDYGGARMAVESLLSLGHRRIACLMEKIAAATRMRSAGYMDALADAGIAADSRWMREGPGTFLSTSNVEQRYLDWGRESMRTWLSEDWAALGCTAIFVQNDMAAAGVMQALQEAGIKVPEQVSVIGFDGTEVCEYFMPRLTAIQVPLSKIGVKAVETLVNQIEGGNREPHAIVLPVRIREGESVGPAP